MCKRTHILHISDICHISHIWLFPWPIQYSSFVLRRLRQSFHWVAWVGTYSLFLVISAANCCRYKFLQDERSCLCLPQAHHCHYEKILGYQHQTQLFLLPFAFFRLLSIQHQHPTENHSFLHNNNQIHRSLVGLASQCLA